MKTGRPRVLFVDDQPALQEPFARSLDLDAFVLEPGDLTVADAQSADLILCDFVLDEWVRDVGSPTTPADGAALAASVRSHLGVPGAIEAPTGFALYSAHLDALAGQLPRETRLHVLSAALNLEWVFPKTGSAEAELAGQITDLARAIRDLPDGWRLEPGHNEHVVQGMFGLNDKSSANARAWADVVSCRPPIHELSTRSHGLALVRWLLHRILPYPTFLWDDARLALRLRVMPHALKTALDATADAFGEFRYQGPLSSFGGRRWWRALFEAYLWRETQGRPFAVEEVRRVVERVIGGSLEPIELAEPVLPLDEQYALIPNPIEAADAVRIQPDDRPAYADQAWVPRDLAMKTPALLAVTLEEDRPTMGSGPTG